MLIWLYGEMREVLWLERELSGSITCRAAGVAFLPRDWAARSIAE
jgi:hypothetical protein